MFPSGKKRFLLFPLMYPRIFLTVVGLVFIVVYCCVWLWSR